MKLFIFTLIFFTTNLFYAQCTKISNNGKYSVDIYVNPIDVVINTTNCPNGYNYNIEIDYTIVINGLNGNPPPANLFTLQGNIICNNTSLFFDLPNGGGSGSVVTVSNPYRNATDCNTITVDDLMCTNFEIQIQGPSMPFTTIDCNPSTFLAVEVINDKISQIESGVELSWETLSERESDYFLIEHSRDGTSWKCIDTVQAQGQSSQLIYYSSKHENVESGYNYYKLTELDLNGKKSLINFYAINIENSTAKLVVYPNPVEEKLTVLGLEENDVQNFVISDAKGMLISNNQYNFYSEYEKLIVDCSALKNGIYFLKFSSGKTLRVVKS